jgi:hypothetical protein
MDSEAEAVSRWTHAGDDRQTCGMETERPWEAAGQHVVLARRCEETGDHRQGAEHYREALRLEHGTNHSHGAELLLAELIVREEFEDCYSEADELLDAFLESDPSFHEQKYRYAVARMRLARRRDQADEAAAFALGALHLFAENQPVSSYHPDIGLIRADDPTLDELEEAATEGNAEAVSEQVERYRGLDGTVRWDWALTSVLRGVPEGSRLQALGDLVVEAQPLVDELRAAGFEVYDLWKWSLRSLKHVADVRDAATILLRWLDKTDSPELKSAIASVLDDPRARKLATSPLLEEFRRMRSPDLNGREWPSEAVGRQRRLKTSLGNALKTLARDEHFDELAELIRDPAHGHRRGYLLLALGHVKSDAAVDLAVEMLEDEEVSVWALRSLAEMRSERGAPIFEAIVSQPRPRGRKPEDDIARNRMDVALAGLNKLAKARVKGKSRP